MFNKNEKLEIDEWINNQRKYIINKCRLEDKGLILKSTLNLEIQTFYKKYKDIYPKSYFIALWDNFVNDNPLTPIYDNEQEFIFDYLQDDIPYYRSIKCGSIMRMGRMKKHIYFDMNNLEFKVESNGEFSVKPIAIRPNEFPYTPSLDVKHTYYNSMMNKCNTDKLILEMELPWFME